MMCMNMRCMFLVKHGFQFLVIHNTWFKVEPKQSTLFFNIHKWFSTLKEDVEQEIETLDDEDVVAWQTWESKSFFKDLFSFEIKSNSFEIKSILFFKDSFSFNKKSSFEDITSFFFKTSSQSYLRFKILFSFRARSSWDFNEFLSFEISSFS